VNLTGWRNSRSAGCSADIVATLGPRYATADGAELTYDGLLDACPIVGPWLLAMLQARGLEATHATTTMLVAERSIVVRDRTTRGKPRTTIIPIADLVRECEEWEAAGGRFVVCIVQFRETHADEALTNLAILPPEVRRSAELRIALHRRSVRPPGVVTIRRLYRRVPRPQARTCRTRASRSSASGTSPGSSDDPPGLDVGPGSRVVGGAERYSADTFGLATGGHR
jgi:hypothetical protein